MPREDEKGVRFEPRKPFELNDDEFKALREGKGKDVLEKKQRTPIEEEKGGPPFGARKPFDFTDAELEELRQGRGAEVLEKKEKEREGRPA